MTSHNHLLKEFGTELPRELTDRKKRVRTNKRLIKQGVIIIDPENTYIEDIAEIGIGATIWPNVFILGKSKLEKAVIKPCSVIENSTIRKNCRIGPFAHIVGESEIKEGAEVGKTEIVRSIIGSGTITKHESYIGDAEVGKNCNIGADSDIRSKPSAGRRVVTCNYDGNAKYKTIIGDDVFIGSGTKIIAPKRIGSKAFIAAGSLVTKDVPEGKELGYLVISRAGSQIMKPNRVRRDKNGWTILKA